MQELVLSAEELELACRTDPELFFAEAPADVELAKALCVDCPIQRACLAGALERREPWGVWGGELFVRGVIVPRKRPRGRPRKDAAPEHGTPPEATESTVAA
ncbi:MAG TPA: WhiB family transcriptional regulator [Streptosporangiaceae bacterium]|jgi:WhiB family redox-sensing transcriptional regulator|nr:WhiB family transcriptional regulator [Streptosporangiaceae bacterium]